MSGEEKMGVMYSIRPHYCSLILRGEKTVELRKTRPKQDPPFKCYIYCTMGKNKLLDVVRDGDDYYGHIHSGSPQFITMPEVDYITAGKRGRVIAEFICDAIAPIVFDKNGVPILCYYGPVEKWLSCVSVADAKAYCGDPEKHCLWAIHISELIQYDTPKKLSQFQIPTTYPARTFRYPPQSWCYAEEVGG